MKTATSTEYAERLAALQQPLLTADELAAAIADPRECERVARIVHTRAQDVSRVGTHAIEAWLRHAAQQQQQQQ